MADAIHAAALHLLTGRALTERELADRLGRRGFAPAAVQRELQRLRHAGLVDDLQVARAACAGLLARGYGRRRLAAALARRGIAAEVARQVLAEISPEDEEAALARALGRVGASRRGEQALPPERAKVIRYLLGRGFPASLVNLVGGSGRYGQVSDSTSCDQGDPSTVP